MKTYARLTLGLLLASRACTPTPVLASVCQALPQLEVMQGSSESITVSSTAIGFTSSKYAPDAGGPRAVYAYVSIESNAIRYWDDGQAPTAAVGHPVAANERFGVCGEVEIRRLRMIRQTADATARVSYYKRKGE